jgi:hypothetical protein
MERGGSDTRFSTHNTHIHITFIAHSWQPLNFEGVGSTFDGFVLLGFWSLGAVLEFLKSFEKT